MTVAWLAVLFLLVVVPLVAWWVGGRPFWRRLSPCAEPDLYRELVRRHSLSPTDAAQVEGAVTWGRELSDPRLRAAVVDWARSLQRLARERSARHPLARRVGWAVLGVGGALAVAALVREVLAEGWGVLGDLPWFTFAWLLLVGLMAGGPRRAVARNSGPVDAG